MSNLKLWVSFHSLDKKIDQWMLCLESDGDADCHAWQLRGEPYDFTAHHIRGSRPESLAGFKEKWLIRDHLTENEARIILERINQHPVDNEGYYWDCRVYCFELLGELETQAILHQEDRDYRAVRKRMHRKWKAGNGVSSDESDEDDEDSGDNHTGADGSALNAVPASNPGPTPPGRPEMPDGEAEHDSKDQVLHAHAQSPASKKKRTLSNASTGAAAPPDAARLQGRRSDPREIKRQKDE